MKRGEVWWVAFDPSIGGEITKTRPAVIVSNNAANRAMNRIQVVPLTSKVGKCYPSEAMVRVNGIAGKALADQVTTVSKLRCKGFYGVLDEGDCDAIDNALRLQLQL